MNGNRWRLFLYRAGSEIAQRCQISMIARCWLKVYGRFARIKALLAQATCWNAPLMMSEATLPRRKQCAGAISTRSTMTTVAPIFRPFPHKQWGVCRMKLLNSSFGQLSFSVDWLQRWLLMVIRATGVCDAYHGGFLPPVWALARWLLFYPACGMGWCAYGILCRRM